MTGLNTRATTRIAGPALDESTLEAVKRHLSGAIVVHNHPFNELPVPTAREELSRNVIDRWVIPLYMNLRKPESEPILASLWPDMNCDVAHALLAAKDWRPRRVGAYIVALRELHELTDEVGRLLLRSDVCYAGGDYCLALAQLNTSQALEYLRQYLDYYLTRNDLWFDQASAMSAVAYLDAHNGTHDLDSFLSRWESFVADKPIWSLERSCSAFSESMARIKTFIVQRR